MNDPVYAPHDGQDHRHDCWFCGEASVAIAPRHTGGDIDVPCHYVPVCQSHLDGWHADLPEDERLPVIPRDGVILSKEQAMAVRLRMHVAIDDDHSGRPIEPEIGRTDIEAIRALDLGLANL